MPTTANFTGGPGSFTIADDFTVSFTRIMDPLQVALLKHIQSYETSFGESAIGIPGSPRNSLANINDTLIDIYGALDRIAGQQTTIAERINAVAGGIAVQATIQQRSVSIQQAAFADQMKNNAISQAEAAAALKRVGIDPQPLPNIFDLGKQIMTDALTLSPMNEFRSVITSVQDDITSTVGSFIGQLGPVTQAKEIISSWFSNLTVVKAVKSVTEAAEVQARKTIEAAQAVRRSGLWKPTPPKIDTGINS